MHMHPPSPRSQKGPPDGIVKDLNDIKYCNGDRIDNFNTFPVI